MQGNLEISLKEKEQIILGLEEELAVNKARLRQLNNLNQMGNIQLLSTLVDGSSMNAMRKMKEENEDMKKKVGIFFEFSLSSTFVSWKTQKKTLRD